MGNRGKVTRVIMYCKICGEFMEASQIHKHICKSLKKNNELEALNTVKTLGEKVLQIRKQG